MSTNSDWPSRLGQDIRMKFLQEAVESEQPTTCAIGIEGSCDETPIQGHIIPEARLVTISENGKVIVAEPAPLTAATRDDRSIDQITFQPVSPRAATKVGFACLRHDGETFRDVEQNEIDWSVQTPNMMRNLTLLAYKATVPIYVRSDRNARIWERYLTLIDHDNHALMPESASRMARTERVSADRARNVKHLLEDMIRKEDYAHMTHIVVQTGSHPLAAANVFFTQSYALAPSQSAAEGRIGYAPHFITAYPSSHGQIVIRSWITPYHPELTILDRDPQKAPERHNHAQMASILLLQHSEVLAVAPSVWENYGSAKRQAIRGHFQTTVPYSTTPLHTVIEAPEPQMLNLFNTTPIIGGVRQ